MKATLQCLEIVLIRKIQLQFGEAVLRRCNKSIAMHQSVENRIQSFVADLYQYC